MSTAPLIFYSQSGVLLDWKCPRARFYGSEYMGKGLQVDETALELYLGTALHDGLAALARKVPIDDIARTAFKQVNEALLISMQAQIDADVFAAEQGTLVEGILRGFNKHVWPRMQQQYPEIVAIEQEILYRHDGLAFMAKPDLLVRDREGNLWYIEYKSTSSNKEQWVNSWSSAVQLHSAIRAVKDTIGEDVTGVIVQGLYKGYMSYGKQGSPFCYAYYKSGNPPFTQEDWQYEYRAGYKRVPTWTRDGGVAKWVESMPGDTLQAQFPQTPPIFLNDGLIDSFFEQRKEREKEISSAASGLMDCSEEDAKATLNLVFPQKFDACNPSFGKGCPFRKLCFGHIEDPLKHGFVLRDTTHREPYLKLAEELNANSK